MKRILIFSTAYFPFVGGAEVAVKEITDRLPDLEFDMITARLDKKLPKQEKIGRINIYRIGCGCPRFDKIWLAFYGGIFAARLHKDKKYNAIWAIMASFGGFAAMFFESKFPQIKYLLTLQEGDDLDHIRKKTKLVSAWFKRIFTSADHIQCISNYLADWAKDMGAKAKIEVVPNGVNVNKFSIFNPPAGRAGFQFSIKDFKRNLGVRENNKVVITTSRLVKKNGVGDIIEAMQYLPENILLLIVGGGELENELKFQISNLKLESRIIMAGFVKPEDIPQYLAVSNVFVRPSLSEGLGNSFLEAMEAGLPVIGTKVGGIPDFLIDGETGLFCEINDPKSIAEKIKLALSDIGLREKMIAKGKRMVEERYDWNLIAGKMHGIFNELN